MRSKLKTACAAVFSVFLLASVSVCTLAQGLSYERGDAIARGQETIPGFYPNKLMSLSQVGDFINELKKALQGIRDSLHILRNSEYRRMVSNKLDDITSELNDLSDAYDMEQAYSMSIVLFDNMAFFNTVQADEGHPSPFSDRLDSYFDVVKKWSNHSFDLSRIYSRLSSQGRKSFQEMSVQELKNYVKKGHSKDYAEAVGLLRNKGERQHLRDLLKGGDLVTGCLMTWAIADLKAEEFEDDIASLLLDENACNRMEAAWFLGDLSRPGYQEKMAKLLSDKSRKVRAEAAYYLTHVYGKPGYEEQMAKLLSDSYPSARVEAAEYLGKTKAVRYKTRVEALLKDPDEKVQKAAKEALEKMK